MVSGDHEYVLVRDSQAFAKISQELNRANEFVLVTFIY